jgi:hypothetical protein
MRGLTKPVASRLYNDFERLLTESKGAARGVAIDTFVIENLNSSAFTVDPMSPAQDRWTVNDYMDFRTKALAAFARAKAVFASGNLDAAQNKASRLIDIELYKLFQADFPISPYEAGAESTWEYLSLVVLPDLVLERHPMKKNETFDEDEIDQGTTANSGTLALPIRFRGGERNAFRRIWIRSYAVSEDLYLLESALEDNLVAIFERTRVAQNPRVSRSALASIAALRNSTQQKIPRLEDIVRDAMKRVVRLMSVKNLDVLPIEDLEALILDTFIESASEFGFRAKL